jgi:hypothetical protein
MLVRLCDEAAAELDVLRRMDEMLAAGVDACLEMLALDYDALEAETEAGFSIESVVALKLQRHADVFRVKYEEFIPSLRILFLRLRGGPFVTGIHDRGNLYDPLKEPLVRAMRYWGRRRYL